ncbi:MAG: ATP-binding protein [Ferruginibacter sp.]
MNTNLTKRSWYKRLTFRGLSIQQRLPLLICVLLSAVILAFSFVSYYGVKKASIEIAKNRLHALTGELGSMFSKSSATLNGITSATARHDSIKKCILSGGTEFSNEAKAILNKLKRDSTWVLIDLLDAHRVPVLRSGDSGVEKKLPLDSVFSSGIPTRDSLIVGKTYAVADSMFYSVYCSVTEKNAVIGYIVIWRSLATSPQALDQLSKLMGTGATLYIGNTDGTLWTNLIKPVSAPPVDTIREHNFFQYTNASGKRVLAQVAPIANTKWLLLVEFSEATILETATRFWNWTLVAGTVLIIIGIFITWVMSRNIIKPINQLTAAATAVASGDHSAPVRVNRLDELGKLADAFNEMTKQVMVNQQTLENKISERTAQLETANKEQEAFSYSISHDLRSPLRGIVGFTSMLESKYGNQLDDEGKRIINIINANTLKMGNLIDDLLSFFRTSRQDIAKNTIPTNDLVSEVIAEQDPKERPVNWMVHPLPDSFGDVNSIRQVWTNLVSNAVKYSRKATASYIEIGSSGDRDQTVFFVKDNGVGFDPRYTNKLFKVFQRLHTSSEFEGTGIGLAIVEKIISRHGGRVWVEAQKDAGATFYFSLPLQQGNNN